MPFQYTPYQSPYTSAIAELIGQRGNIAAQQQQNRANLIGNVTNAVTSSLGDILKYKMDAPKREMEALQLANAKQAAADATENRAAATLYGNLLSGNYTPGYERQGPSLTSPTGTLPTYGDMTTKVGNMTLFDRDKVAQAMAAAGHGAWAIDHLDKVDAMNASRIELQNAKNNVLQKYAIAYASTPDQVKLPAANEMLKTLQDSGVLTDDQLKSLSSQLYAGDVSGINAAIRQYLPQAAPVVLGKGQSLVQPNLYGGQSRTLATGASPDITPTEDAREIRAARAAIQAGTATPEQRDLVAGADADIAAKRNLTPQDQFLNTFAKSLGLSDSSQLNREQTLKALSEFRNATRFQPQSSSVGGVTLADNPYSNIVGVATFNLPAQRQAAAAKLWNSAVKSGNQQTMRNTARAIITETLPFSEQAAMSGRAATIGTLERVQKELQTVPQGLLQGTMQQVLNRLGTGDPTQKAAANRIQLALNNYTKAITGAQMSEAERQAYARVFPSYTNSGALNASIIQTLLDEMKGFDASTYATVLGGDQDAVNWLVGSPKNPKPETSSDLEYLDRQFGGK